MADNKLQSLTEIFNERLFRIPDFQRGYSWGESQIEDFWEDLKYLKDGNTHYTGLLTIQPVPKREILTKESWSRDRWLLENSMKAFYLIDGQQRLTTSIILLNEILSLLKDDEAINYSKKFHWVEKFLFKSYEGHRSYIFGYEQDNPSDEFFKTKILGQESLSADKQPEQTVYTANLRYAKAFFYDNLKNSARETLEKMFIKLTSRFRFNLYEIDDELDVFVTFETMNNRGKPLSNLELLKNRLIYITTILEQDDKLQDNLRKDINEAWKTIYEYLGKNEDKKLPDDDFLRNHWIMYFKYDRKRSESYAKFLLDEKFTSQKAIQGGLKIDEIRMYIESLSKSVKSWYYIHNAGESDYKDETKEWFQKLNRVGMSAFAPLIMAAMIKCKNENEELLPLLKSAERFIFLVFKISQRQSNTKNSHFYRLANSFYKGATMIDNVIADIQQSIDGKPDEEIKTGALNIRAFQNHIKEQFEKGEGFYSWNGLHYFLYEYELFLQDKANDNPKISWTDFDKRKKEDTIEHIFPKKTEDGEWAAFTEYADGIKKAALLHGLGNLLLLRREKNSELQNNEFEHKKKHINKHGDDFGYFNGSFSEIEVATCSQWTPSAIKERGERMLRFMEERWEFDFGVLGLDKSELLLLKDLNKPISQVTDFALDNTMANDEL